MRWPGPNKPYESKQRFLSLLTRRVHIRSKVRLYQKWAALLQKWPIIVEDSLCPWSTTDQSDRLGIWDPHLNKTRNFQLGSPLVRAGWLVTSKAITITHDAPWILEPAPASDEPRPKGLYALYVQTAPIVRRSYWLVRMG